MKISKLRLKEDRVLKAIKFIREQKGIVNLNDLTSEACLSPKQFYRRFKDISGFNPKLYSRIIRFEFFLYHHYLFSSLADAAYRLGYSDQAHFNHDFKEFSGFSPLEFFKLPNK